MLNMLIFVFCKGVLTTGVGSKNSKCKCEVFKAKCLLCGRRGYFKCEDIEEKPKKVCSKVRVADDITVENRVVEEVGLAEGGVDEVAEVGEDRIGEVVVLENRVDEVVVVAVDNFEVQTVELTPVVNSNAAVIQQGDYLCDISLADLPDFFFSSTVDVTSGGV